MKDILLDKYYDLKIMNGDFAIGESEMQEVGLILQSVQGEWKESPVIGPNLFQLINSKNAQDEFIARVKLHLSLDNKDYNDIKNKIQTTFKTI